MKWQEAERELRIWELEGCNCPNAHGGPHFAYIPNRPPGVPGCPGLTRAAHNLKFARLYGRLAKELRKEMAAL